MINGERLTGVTTFMIDKDIDTGGIILRQDVRIGRDDTAGDVHDRLMEVGAKLVVETTEGLIQHTVETRVQRSFIQGSEVLKPAPKLTKENTRIDWSRRCEAIRNFVRGLNPYPSAWTTLVRDGVATDVKIFSVAAAQQDTPSLTAPLHSAPPIEADGPLPLSRGWRRSCEGVPAAPGSIMIDGSRLLVATNDGWLEVRELQLAGKKRMAADAFLRGFRDIDNCKFV